MGELAGSGLQRPGPGQDPALEAISPCLWAKQVASLAPTTKEKLPCQLQGWGQVP